MKTFVTILVAAAMTALSFGAIAAPDENQRMMTQQIAAAVVHWVHTYGRLQLTD